MTQQWFSTEEIFVVGNIALGIVKYYADDGWYAAAGEYFDSEEDHLVETEYFDTKDDAKEWIKSRLTARGYI